MALLGLGFPIIWQARQKSVKLKVHQQGNKTAAQDFNQKRQVTSGFSPQATQTDTVESERLLDCSEVYKKENSTNLRGVTKSAQYPSWLIYVKGSKSGDWKGKHQATIP